MIAERGVRSVKKGRGQLPPVYSWRQKRRGAGILFTVHRPNGETATIFRPDEPRPDKPGHKYEQECKHLGGSGNVLDVHPSVHHLVGDTSVPLVFTEGIKKADSITSATRREGIEVIPVGISGVWNFVSEGEPIQDMRDLPVEGRKVWVCFDSDMLRNPNVQMAAERLAGHLAGYLAEVQIVYLPDQPDGSKNGADDFLAGGGTLEELLALARPFDPEAIQREKLSRNEPLRRYLDALARQEKEMPAKSSRDCSKLAAWRTCRTLAGKHGKLVEDGIEVIVPSMTGAENAGMSQNTFSTCISAFEEEGLVRRIKPERRELADSYVLLGPRAKVYNNGNKREGPGERGKGNSSNDNEDHRGYRPLRAPVPELRWSYVAVVREQDARGRLQEVYEYVARLGKKRGEVVRHLLENGGHSTVPELMDRFAGPQTRPRDFVRRFLADLLGYRRQYKGSPLSVGPPIIEIEDGAVRLVDGWLEALEEHQALGGEQDAAIRQKANHLRWRAAYRAFLAGKHPPDPAPTEEQMEQQREARRKRRRIDELVGQGMARGFATEAVIGADGFVEELRPVEEPADPPQEEHPLDCECLECSARAPSYARLKGGCPAR